MQSNFNKVQSAAGLFSLYWYPVLNPYKFLRNIKSFQQLTGQGPCPAEPLPLQQALGSRLPHSQYRPLCHWRPFQLPTSMQVCWGPPRWSAPPAGSGCTCTTDCKEEEKKDCGFRYEQWSMNNIFLQMCTYWCITVEEKEKDILVPKSQTDVSGHSDQRWQKAVQAHNPVLDTVHLHHHSFSQALKYPAIVRIQWKGKRFVFYLHVKLS